MLMALETVKNKALFDFKVLTATSLRSPKVEFSLLRENLTWQQLSTVIQTSIVEAADKEPLSLYYSSNSEINTLSDEDEFSQLLLNNKGILGLRLYDQSQENMEPVHILPLVNGAFKRLFDLIQHHDLESDIHLSKMFGILAARIAYSPHRNFDDDLTSLENMLKDLHSKMKSRKMLLKHPHHRKLHKKMVHHRKHPSHSNDGEIFEFLSRHPSKEQGLHRCGRREFHHHHHPHRSSDENLNDIVDLNSDDDLSSETGNNEHVQDKYAESDTSMSSLSDSESGNEHEEGGRFGRHGHHTFGPFHPHGRFGNGRRHGRHNLGGFGGPGFSGPGIRGPKFGGELGRRHHHGRREEIGCTGFESMYHHFGCRGHHYGRKHEGEKVFLFA